MKKEKPHCLLCISFIVKDEQKPTQEYICSNFNHVISSDDVFTEVDCNSYQRRPYTCASCGAEISNSCRKIETPVHMGKGRYSGTLIKCCDGRHYHMDCDLIIR